MAMEDPVLDDGRLRFRVRRQDGTETTHEMDLLSLKLTCERCEDDHHLEVRDGRMNPTPEFLQDLAQRLATVGFNNCTPTLAWQVWVAATEAMGRLKNSPSETPS